MSPPSRCLAWIPLLASLLALPAAAEPLRIVATIPPYAMIARAVAGEEAQVHTLLRRGHDPHHYEPAVRDMARLERADLMLANGIGQQRLESQLDNVGGNTARLIMAKAVEFEPVRDEAGRLNGHIWLDPRIMSRAARTLGNRLARIRPEAEEHFQANVRAFQAAVAEADDANRELLADLPTHHVVTFHPGFDYFFRHYGLRVAGAYRDLAGGEPSPRRVNELLSRIHELGIPAIFREPQLPADPVRALAREAGVRVGVLDPLGFNEGISSYPELLRHNARAIHDAYTR